MGKVLFENKVCEMVTAEPSDEQGIKELFEQLSYNLKIELQFQRGKNPYWSYMQEDKGAVIILCKLKETGQIVGIGACSFHHIYLDGEQKRGGYLNGLKILPEYYGFGRYISKAFDAMKKCVDGKADVYYVSILSDAIETQKIFEKTRANMPQYSRQCLYTSFMFRPAKQAKDFIPIFEIRPVLAIGAGTLFCSIMAAYMACRRMWKENAISLMNNGINKVKHTTKDKERSVRFPLYLRMALRNIWANKRILVTTIVGVAGCMILLTVVFTVRFGMAGITDQQYRQLQHYDGTVVVRDGQDKGEPETFLEEDERVQSIPVCERYDSFFKDNAYHYATLISSEDSALRDFITIEDVDTKENTNIPKSGILISKKIAEEYNYQVGDDFIITNTSGENCTGKVAGIGLVLGGIIGTPLGAYITRAIELEGIQNIRSISWSACFISAGICAVFVLATNLLSLLKIPKIKMTGTVRQT